MSRPIIILLGPPGCGKTTIAPLLARTFGLKELKIQDLVDAEIARDTEAGDYLRRVAVEGRKSNDVILLDLCREELKRYSGGVIFSDFPGELSQSQALDKILIKSNEKSKFRLLELSCSDEVCEERLALRWVDKESGRPYNVESAPPKSLPEGAEPCGENMVDDATGEPLVRLAKDGRLKIPKCLFCYHLGTEPILEHFGRLYCSRVNADQPIAALATECAQILVQTTFKKELSFLERSIGSSAPLPQCTNAPEAETRVRDFGDRLERRAPILVARTRHGDGFQKCSWAK